jgi:hypothetical protein
MKLAVLFIAAIGSAVVGSGCGGSTSPSAPSGPSTPANQPAPETIRGSVGAYGISSHEVVSSAGGRLTVTLTWTAGVDLDLYLTDTQCAGYPPDQCALLASSTSSTGLREEVVWTVQPQERLKVWVDNFSRSELAQYTIVITTR